MTLWDNFRKKLTAIIDLPIEAVQNQQPRLAPSGISPSAHYVYPVKQQQQTPPKGKMLREAAATYSHGFEKIYALETVDPRTIRVLGSSQDKAIETKPVHHDVTDLCEFDFGPSYRRWITPCFLLEPIQVLGLSSQAEKILSQQGWVLIQDLLSITRDSLVHLRGFGQGHIDELFHKLAAYVNGRNTRYSTTIHWDAWLRSICTVLSNKEAKILAESFGLGEAIAIPAYLSGEIRRMKEQEKKSIVQNALKTLRESSVCETVRSRWQEILHAFVVPWVKLRNGVVHREELMERLQCVSGDSSYGLKFLEALLGKKAIFDETFSRVEEDLFVLENGCYDRVLEKAFSYYYKPSLHYRMDELSIWIMRELAKEWMTCSLEDIVKVLSYSASFALFKGEDGVVKVRMAFC